MLKEKYYQEMEPGVRDIVKALNTYGVDTHMSCEGHDDCSYGGLFAHRWYVEISGMMYEKHEQQLKRLSRLSSLDLRVIIDPTKRCNDRFFLVGEVIFSKHPSIQEEVVKAIHKAWGK